MGDHVFCDTSEDAVRRRFEAGMRIRVAPGHEERIAKLEGQVRELLAVLPHEETP